MSTSVLMGIIVLGSIFLLQISYHFAISYKFVPKYLRIFKYLKKAQKKLDDQRPILMLDIRYKLMEKFNLTPDESWECLQHIKDPDSKWFQETFK